ncbi:MAG TPA: LytTR family DNA-binding domain-containing protein, partial [Chitinophagaceae bacterium]|nr:LytTR family DNA-binding domain-containing protein [Chitinophagaceae bacterium]
MNSNISYTSISASIRFKTWCCTVLVVCIFGTLGLDWITARLSQSSFYFSESFLFSSFWWLFVPGLLLQFRLAHSFKSIGSQILLIALPALWHLFAYPALVWMLSSAFYDHSFAYRQTLHFELQAYSFVLLFAYTLPFIFFKIGNNKIQVLEKAEAPAQVPDVVSTITSLWVNDGKRKIQIYPRDIFYITSSSPYIYLHLQQKKYLHSQSLKSILQQL